MGQKTHSKSQFLLVLENSCFNEKTGQQGGPSHTFLISPSRLSAHSILCVGVRLPLLRGSPALPPGLQPQVPHLLTGIVRSAWTGPCTRPHTAPLLPVALPTRGLPLQAYTAPAPSGVCMPSPPPGHGHLPRWSSARPLPLPTSSVVPTGKRLPCGSPKPILHLTHCSWNSLFPLRGTGCTQRTPFHILLSDLFTNCMAADQFKWESIPKTSVRLSLHRG